MGNGSMVQQITEEHVDELIKDKEWFEILHKVMVNLRNGFYKNTEYFFQYEWHHKPDIYDAYNFIQIHTAVCTGQIIFCKVYIGEGPHSDANVDGNNEILSKLWYPFRAKFVGGLGGNDGSFWVDEPIEMDSVNPDTNERIHQLVSGWFPLEVGYTYTSTSWWHFAESHKLARWPYGSKEIILFAKIDDKLWGPPEYNIGELLKDLSND